MESVNRTQRIDQPAGDGRRGDPSSEGGARHYLTLGRELLSGMLERQSIASIRSDSPPLRADELEAVRAVVNGHRGEPLSLNPVAVGLVRALVTQWFAPSVADSRTLNSWNAIADRIAASLYDDPVGRDRLHTIWERLCAE